MLLITTSVIKLEVVANRLCKVKKKLVSRDMLLWIYAICLMMKYTSVNGIKSAYRFAIYT